MSKGFEYVTSGPWTVMDERTVLSADPNVAICDAFPADKSGDKYHHGESSKANARLIAEAGTVLHETGLTPRQLAEQRAELLEALHKRAEMPDRVTLSWLESDREEIGLTWWPRRRQELEEAGYQFVCENSNGSEDFALVGIGDELLTLLANATQQRNATGGEG